ncbi:hypothetical protein D3C81_1663550 [compost metagenome]
MPSITPVCMPLNTSLTPITMELAPIAFKVSSAIGLACTRIFIPCKSSGLITGFLVIRLRVPASIQPRNTSRDLLFAVRRSPISWPIIPSSTLCIWSSSRKIYGRVKTLISGSMAATGVIETRIISMAPNCACSIICFSSPNTPPGKVLISRRPSVAALSFSPMCFTATTFG